MTRAADLAKLIAGGGSITVDDNSTNITLKSTDADSNLGPILDLLRDGGSPADSDFIGQVRFQAKDDGGNIHEYAKIFGQIADVTGGTEDGILNIRTVLGGTDTRRIDLGVTETVFNEDSADVDFRIESDGNANALIVDAGHSTVGINTAAVSNRTLKIEGEGNLGAILSLNESTRGGLVEFSAGSGTELYIGSELGILGSGNNNELLIHTGVSAVKIDRSGNVGIGTTSPDADLTIPSPSFGSGGTGNGIRFQNTNNDADAIIQSYYSGTSASALLHGQNLYLATNASFTNFDSSKASSYILQNTDGQILFANASSSAPSERMRIDSSGTVRIANTSGNLFDSSSATGVVAGTSLQVSTDGSTVGFFNRLSSNGQILGFYKDGTQVGQISSGELSSANRILIGNSNCNLLFNDAVPEIVPASSNGVKRDGDIDLGNATGRFQDIRATNGTIQTSDKNEKNTIVDSDLGIDFINRLSPKSYKFNNKTRTHYGLIAQDVETVLGDIKKDASQFAGFCKDDISEKQDGSEHRYGLRYHEFISPMIQAIKDLKAEVDTPKAKVATLESK